MDTSMLPCARLAKGDILNSRRPVFQTRSKTGIRTIVFAKKGDKVVETDGEINTEDILKDCVSFARYGGEHIDAHKAPLIETL